MESKLLKQIWLAASGRGLTLWRNNVGTATTTTGQFIRFGLCPGSSDLIGFTPVEINGKFYAIFTCIEVKTPNGKISKEQMNFIEFINKNGGIGKIVRSIEEI